MSNKEKLCVYLKKLTKKYLEKSKKDDIDYGDLSEKAKRLYDLLPNFGCQQETVKEVFEILLEEKLPDIPLEETKRFLTNTGVMIVLKDNPNDHDYKLDTPYIVHSEHNRAISCEGVAGNNLPLRHEGAIEYATDEQIDFFFDNVKEEVAEKLIEKYFWAYLD